MKSILTILALAATFAANGIVNHDLSFSPASLRLTETEAYGKQWCVPQLPEKDYQYLQERDLTSGRKNVISSLEL